MENYPPNSRKAKDEGTPVKSEEKKVEKVVSGDVVRRKKSLSKRFREAFIGDDAQGVVSYVTFDVLIPAAKDMIVDAGTQALERAFFGEGSGRSRSSRSSSARGSSTFTNYRGFSTAPRREEEPRSRMSRRSRVNHNFDDLIIDTRVEAEEVLDHLFELVSKYEAATVADLYEMTGITGEFTDEKWGWTDLRGSHVRKVRGGWRIDLPRPEPID